ncbi:hypothetical protein [Jannaschia sp. LMIT008]|uniref:hypothetical protein n=1 Tax=Jannaschia maritima TaxID=3032585 RepID=UPI002812247A|nr:hypothetical protein [Jannaschia sp. LMIT008]
MIVEQLDARRVQAAQRELDAVTRQWIEVGVDAGLFVASLNPTGGQIADGISLSRNVAAGNYGAAVVDGVGMVPVLGDIFKGFFRGRRIARAVTRADEALRLARQNMQQVGTIARRRVAARTLTRRMRRRRDEILERYRGCDMARCRADRDAELRELYGPGNLPAPGTGSFRNADGSPAPVGEGVFVPDPNDRTGSDLHEALQNHGAVGIPYSAGRPDLSGFPPPGSSAPDGRAWRVDIEQSLTGDRAADRNASWGAWRERYGSTHSEPRNGHWHHAGDGASMMYVDRDIHGPLSHIGDASINQTPEF